MGHNPDFDLYKLSDEHVMLRGVLREMVAEKIAPFAADVDEKERWPQEAHDALKELGMAAPHIPEEYGGQGADHLATAIVIEEIARGCASASLIPAVNELGSMPIILYANEDVKQKYLPPVASGEALIAYGLSEREAGSDVASMVTEAKQDGDHWILNGHKTWISNAGLADYYTVMAVTDPNAKKGRHITAFVVEKGDEGFTFGEKERKMGIKGSPTRELYFENVRIPDDRRIGDVGAGMMVALGTLDHTRTANAAQAIGIAQGALDCAVAYVKERKQFGKAIAEFQGVQFMLADMGMNLEAARQLCYVSAAKSERMDPDVGYFGAAVKAFASDVAMQICIDAVQLLGGAGYTRDFPAERAMRDVKICQIYEGTNQIQRIVMARHLLR